MEKMKTFCSRRDFLKLGLLTLTTLAFRPFFTDQEEREPISLGRVTIDKISVFAEPDFESQIVGQRYLDQLITLYYPVNSPKGPQHNPLWFRVWGGYVYSAYLQYVKTRIYPIVENVPKEGKLFELTVPYSQAWAYDPNDGWYRLQNLYYETTHWVTGIDIGPDGQLWYKITSELDRYLSYYIPANHMRQIPDEEMTPISPEVDPEEKSIEVCLRKQTLTAFEGDKEVLQTKISSGLPSKENLPKGTRTPTGIFNISSKYPSKHMGEVRATGAPDTYSLPGVPWSLFFVYEYGVALHGTYWHNNFGAPMSHGCVNMRNEDAKWLFRWTTPTWEIPPIDASKWDRRGRGTKVWVYDVSKWER